MFRSFQTFVLGLAFAVVGIAGERHSVGFDNACGFGTPTLIGPSGEVLSSGNTHTVNAGFNARAFLQTGDCGSDGARCTTVEMNLGAAQSFVDISLLSGFSVETAFEFVNQCSGRGASCANEDCPNAIRSPGDSSALVMCPSPDVDLLITFCGGSTDQPQPNPQPDPEQDPDITSSSASTTDRDESSQTTPTSDSRPATSDADRELTTSSFRSSSSTQSQSGSSTDNSSSTPTSGDSGSSPSETPSETGVNEQESGDGPDGGDNKGPNGEGEGKKDGGFSKGAIIGVAVTGAIVGAILVLLLLFCLRKKRRQRRLSQMGKRGVIRDDEDCYFDTPNSTAHLTVSPYHQTSAQTYPPIHPDKLPLPSTPAVVTNIPPPTRPPATSPSEGNDTSDPSAGSPTSAPTSNHDSTSPTSTDPHDQQRLLDLVRSLQERIDQIDGDGTATQVPPPPYAPQHS